MAREMCGGDFFTDTPTRWTSGGGRQRHVDFVLRLDRCEIDVGPEFERYVDCQTCRWSLEKK
jgi:hypothetical protein